MVPPSKSSSVLENVPTRCSSGSLSLYRHSAIIEYTAKSLRLSSTLSYFRLFPLACVWIRRILSFARIMQPIQGSMPNSSDALTLANGSSGLP